MRRRQHAEQLRELRGAYDIRIELVGNGVVDTRAYCARPLKTELRVTAADVALSGATLLVYTPHTLYITCER